MAPLLKNLPAELQDQIFGFLSSKDLAMLALSSSGLQKSAEYAMYTGDIKEARQVGSRALFRAAYTDNTKTAQKSLEHGGRHVINCLRRRRGWCKRSKKHIVLIMTPLFHAAQCDNTKILAMLLDNGAQVDKPSIVYTEGSSNTYWLMTAFAVAVSHKNVLAAHLLLSRGSCNRTAYRKAAAPENTADVFLSEMPQSAHCSALGDAVYLNLPSVVGNLLLTFLDINEVCRGQSALQLAASNPETVPLIPKILAAGASIVSIGHGSLSPLHCLATLENQDAAIQGIRYIAEARKRFNPNILDVRECTPLAIAASRFSAEIVRELLAQGASVNFGPPLQRPMRMITSTVMTRAQRDIKFDDEAVIACINQLREAKVLIDPICLQELGQVDRLDLITQLSNPEDTIINV